MRTVAGKHFRRDWTWQPIFYPVLNQEYAEQIAQEWNTRDAFSGYCGIVTRFEVQATYILNFKVENVGAAIHNELWIPAEELANFNKHISDKIEVLSAFFGIAFTGTLHEEVNKKLLKFIP